MTDQPKAEIKKVHIALSGTEYVLSLEEARELKAILDRLFPGVPFASPNPIVYPAPVYVPIPEYPWRYWRERYWDGEIIITCNSFESHT